MNLKLIITIVIIFAIAFFIAWWVSQPKKSYGWYQCDTDNCLHTPSDNNSPTPHPTKTPTPTCTPKPTSTPKPTATPTASPSATPSPTPGPGNSNTLVNDTTEASAAPICQEIKFISTPLGWSPGTVSGSMDIRFTPVDSFVNAYVVHYGLDKTASNWNTICYPKVGFDGNLTCTLNQLPIGHSIWWTVSGTANGCVGKPSVPFDPVLK